MRPDVCDRTGFVVHPVAAFTDGGNRGWGCLFLERRMDVGAMQRAVKG